MNNTERDFINLITNSISGKQITEGDFDYLAMLSLAKKHGVVLTIYNNLLSVCPTQEEKKRLKKAHSALISQAINQEYCQKELFDAFNNAEICFLPLKGERIKNLYPQKYMRFSSDVDVFIKETDKNKVDKVMKNLGYKLDHYYAHEISYILPPYVNVEIHVRIDHHTDKSYYDDIWNNLNKTSNYGYEFYDDDFYVNFILHLYKHFHVGGSGIRSVIDIYLMNEKFNLNRDYIKKELGKFNLCEFEKQFYLLAKCYFENEPFTELLSDLSDYVFGSGIFGTIENRTNAEIGKKQNKFLYLLKRIFPSYAHMLKSYPSLKKCPPLLPVYWIIRIFKSIFFKRQLIKSSIGAIHDFDEEKTIKQQNLFEKLKINKE